MINLNNAESRVKRAEIQLEEAKKNYLRYKELYTQQVIPESEYLTYEIAWKTASEELNAAEDNLQLIREGATKKQDRPRTRSSVQPSKEWCSMCPLKKASR